jgi:UDP-N-acetylglucosamine diphosphorylase/glucosamine-1-phosphate N-acetyltransferase
MNILLVDPIDVRQNLLPFTYTRPVSEIRVGIHTIAQKWMNWLGESQAAYLTDSYLQTKFPNSFVSGTVINGSICPNADLLNAINKLDDGERLISEQGFVALRTSQKIKTLDELDLSKYKSIIFEGEFCQISKPWDIFHFNAEQIRSDFELITKGRTSRSLTDPHTILYGSSKNLFIEPGASIRAAVLNCENGPVYIGKNAQVHEGALIKGTFALCEGSHVNMGAKIKGDSTIGPYCKVGGEISNSVFFGYSNKAHDGFIGNSVVGEWCNLGADTNTSNLKNNYDWVKLWSYRDARFVNTGLQFCGLMMGDHAKAGINTMFNTGTVIGVGSNIFGAGFPRNFIPSFSWGGAQGLSTFKLEKFFQTAEKVMDRRKEKLTLEDRSILNHIFEQEAIRRTWDKK